MNRKCTDPYCPCQDGDPCHYLPYGDTPAWPLPPGVELVEGEPQKEQTYGPGWPE